MSKESVLKTVENKGLLYTQYKNLAISRFKWTGLPKGITERYIEKSLYENGMVALVDDNILSFLALPCSSHGGVNPYGEFTQFAVTGYGYQEIFTEGKKCVVIRNNDLSYPTRPYIEMYTQRLTNIERTLDVNVSQQKHPYIIKTNDKGLLTFKNLYKKVAEDEPVIYGDKSLDMNSIEVFPTLAPFIAIEMMDYKNQVRNELLTFLGINNTNTDKKERLVTSEVDSNNELISSNFEMMLKARQDACEKIKEVFGITVTVEPRIIGEVQTDEPVHDGSEGDS